MDGPGRAKSVRMCRTTRRAPRVDPRQIEGVQRCRIWLDVGAAALRLAEAHLGPFHETTQQVREALTSMRRTWERHRAVAGSVAVEAMLAALPRAFVRVGAEEASSSLDLILIEGTTYDVRRMSGTRWAPVQWRLRRLLMEPHDEAFYAVRLSDGSTQCDCADWTYRVQTDRDEPCKHIQALRALDWL